jgi:hypothetical protein
VSNYLEGARKRELDHLKETEKQIGDRTRYSERPYLQGVYELYCDWEADKRPKARSAQMAKLCKISTRKDAHPIRIIIDCSSPSTDEKMKSRWTLALRFAQVRGVPPSKLLDFLNEKGGLAGRARAFTKWQNNAASAKKKTSPTKT